MKSVILVLMFFGFASTSFGKVTRVPLFLAKDQYAKLSPAKRTQYIKGVRDAFYTMETTLQKFYPRGKMNSGVSFEFLSAAQADWSGDSCFIGGAKSKVVNGKCLSRGPGLSCTAAGITDGFQCGGVFGGACISRNPVDAISKNCRNAARDASVTPEKYAEFVKEAQKNYDDMCTGTNKDMLGCRMVGAKLMVAKQTVEDKPKGQTELQTVADKDAPPCAEPAFSQRCVPGGIRLSFSKSEPNKGIFGTCVREGNGYVNTVSSTDVASFLEKYKNNADIKKALVALGASQRDFKKEGEWVELKGEMDREALQKFASAYNTHFGLCQQIDDLRTELNGGRDAVRGAPIDMETLKDFANYNSDKSSDFGTNCAEGTTVSPRAIEIASEDPYHKNFRVFPREVLADGPDKWKMEYSMGKETSSLIFQKVGDEWVYVNGRGQQFKFKMYASDPSYVNKYLGHPEGPNPICLSFGNGGREPVGHVSTSEVIRVEK